MGGTGQVTPGRWASIGAQCSAFAAALERVPWAQVRHARLAPTVPEGNVADIMMIVSAPLTRSRTAGSQVIKLGDWAGNRDPMSGTTAEDFASTDPVGDLEATINIKSATLARACIRGVWSFPDRISGV